MPIHRNKIIDQIAFSMAMALIGSVIVFGIAVIFVMQPAMHKVRGWWRMVSNH